MSTAAPWLAHYDAGVPATLAPYPDRTLRRLSRRRARASARTRPALLFKGATITYGELDRAERRAAPRRSRRSACSAATASALLLPNCPQFFIAAVRRLEDRRHRRAAESDLHRARARRAAARARHRDGRHADAVLRSASSACSAKTGVAPRHRDQHQGVFSAAAARAVHAVRARSATAIASRSQPGDHDFAHLLLVEPRPQRRRRAPIAGDDPAVLLMSGGTTGTPKGVLGTHGAYVHGRPADQGVERDRRSAARTTSSSCRCRCFTSTRNVGVQALAFINGDADGAGAEPARPRRSAGDDPPREAGVLQRRADALHRAAQPSDWCSSGKIDFKSITHLLLRRRAAAGRHQDSDSKRSPAAASSKAIR